MATVHSIIPPYSLDSMMKNLGFEEVAYMKIQPHTMIIDPNKVIETKPLNGLLLVETDSEVLNKVPDKVAAQTDELKTSSREEEAAKFVPFTGIARRLDGSPSIVKAECCVAELRTTELKTSSRGEKAAKFVPFTGIARQLMDGSCSIVKSECCATEPRTVELKTSSRKRTLKRISVPYYMRLFSFATPF
ncbi:hypothetical protein LguiB_004469 [Lonicera macranthoides]